MDRFLWKYIHELSNIHMSRAIFNISIFKSGSLSVKMYTWAEQYSHEPSNIQSNLEETCLLTFSLCLAAHPPPTKQVNRFKNKLFWHFKRPLLLEHLYRLITQKSQLLPRSTFSQVLFDQLNQLNQKLR